jgi:ddrB-like ParB superfamily domain
MEEATDYLTELARRGAARGPATFGQIWDAEWQRTGLDTFGGVGQPMLDSYGEAVSAVEKAYGGKQTYGELARTRQLSVVGDARFATLGKLIDDIPDEAARTEAEKFRDVRGRAAEKARVIERNASEIGEATYGLSGTAVSYAAGIARQAVDPVNLLANFVPVGGPLTGRVLPMLARQALQGAGAQALQEPYIEGVRAELGLEAGIMRGLTNIGEAAVGAAGISGLLRAGAWGLRAASRNAFGKDIAWLTPDVAPSGDFRIGERSFASIKDFYRNVRNIAPEDMEATARLVERDQVIDASRPGIEQAPKIDEASLALETGKPINTVQPIPARFAGDDTRYLVRPGGARLEVRPAVVELGDLVVSHNIDGVANPVYPAELQPRDRAAPASRTWVAEKAAELEPALLGEAPTAGLGAPVIGSDGVVESGNGRVMLIARAYDRHPEHAAAYRAMLEEQGYDVADMKYPVLVRVRQGELGMLDRAKLALEANVSATAGLSVRERAIADAKELDTTVMAAWRGGEVTSTENAPFVRAFADRLIAPEERPQYMDKNNRPSADGVRRIEAALVQKAWGAEDIVQALYESADANSRAILGGMADAAPTVARLKSAIEDGRVPVEADPTPAMLEAFRLVDQARGRGQRIGEAINQIDLERGAVPEPVREAVKLYFRDEALRQAAGRDTVAARINKSVERALEHQNAIGDLFGLEPNATNALRAGKLEGVAPDDLAMVPEPVSSELPIAPQRLASETDKEFAKRVVDKRELPAELPEAYEKYFKLDGDTKIIKLADLVSSKTPEENAKGGNNSPKRMAASAAGELDRRAPITVSQMADGKYLIIDGNGTVSGVQPYGWQAIPVKMLENMPTPVTGVVNTATRAPLPSLFADGNLVTRPADAHVAFDAQRDHVVLAQPFATLDEAIARAETNQPVLIAELERAAAGHGQVKDPGVKFDRPRMEDKVRRKYKGETRRITDLARGGVTVNSPEAAQAIIGELASNKQLRIIDEGWKVYEDAGGFFDRKLEVALPDGQVTEIQIWPPEIYAAKRNGGDAIYKRYRAASTLDEAKKIEAELLAFWAPVIAQLDERWAPVMGGSPKAVSASLYARLASASEIRSPSESISPAGTSSQPSAPIERPGPVSGTTAKVEPQEYQRAGIAEPPPKDMGTLGDPVKAQEAKRALEELGSDFELWFPDGSKRSALELIEQARNDARAAAELEACIGEAAE